MAITQDEMLSIINAVLSSIRTNSRTIGQLTAVTSLNDNDSFEIDGGKRVTYAVLRGLIESLSSIEHDSLKNLITKSELKSVSVTATENSATLSISTGGKTITTSIPIATTSKAGLMTATDKVKLQSAYDSAVSAKSITDTKGLPNGIAPLDPNGIVPAEHLPDRENVVEFGSIVSGVELQFGSSEHSSTDAGCMVVYDKDHHKFLLAEVLRLPAEVDNGATVQSLSTDSEASDYSESGSLVDPGLHIIRKFKYYPNWQDGDSFGSASLAGRVPKAGKLYVLTSENKIYHWSGTELEVVGTGLALGHSANSAYPGDEGVETNKKVDVLRDEFDSHVLSSERTISNLQDEVDSYAMPVLVDLPDMSYRLGKIPLVSLNGIVDAVEELDGLETVYGTTNYYFVRREKAIYWIDYDVTYGPIQSVSTIGMAPIMITDALFVCKNSVYSFDGESLHRLLTTADLGSVVPASLDGLVKRRHIMLTAEPGNVYRNYNNYIKISSHADTLYTLKQGDVFRVDLNGFYAGNGRFCKPLSECVIACVGKSGGSQATEFEYEIEDNGVLRAVWPYEEAQLGVAVCLQVYMDFIATKHSHVTLQRTSDGKRIFTFLDSYDETEVSLSSDFELETYLDIKEKKLCWSPAVLVQMWGWRRGVWKWRNIKNVHAFHPRDSFILRVRRRTRKARVMSEWIVLRCMLVNGKWELRKA